MGGSFDPIHFGHLVAAEQARHDLDLDEVVFVPAGAPWQKGRTVAGAEHRYVMTVLATADNPAFSVSRIELDDSGPTYTLDTLKRFRVELPDHELYFITGADAILNILTWKSADAVLDLATFVGATRPGHDLSDLEAAGLRDRVVVLDVPALAISSTDLRERFASGRPVRYLTPPQVEQYARKHGLYGTDGYGLSAVDFP